MKTIILCVAVLNLLDALFTFIGLSIHAVMELNPMMYRSWQASPLLFILIKGTISLLLLYLLRFAEWFHERTIWKAGFHLAAAFYTFLLTLHVYWISHVL